MQKNPLFATARSVSRSEGANVPNGGTREMRSATDEEPDSETSGAERGRRTEPEDAALDPGVRCERARPGATSRRQGRGLAGDRVEFGRGEQSEPSVLKKEN
jgi:hypothetical protein